MKVFVLENKKQFSEKASEIVSKLIKGNPKSILGLATGKTMIPFYKNLTKNKLDFSKVKTFNLDEYVNVKYKNSFHYFMDKHFFSKINISKENIYFPNSKTKKTPKRDLQILGIGRNGHIGFNEPGSKRDSSIRKVKLARKTLIANKLFGERYAYTFGIKEIMNSKKIILLAFGKEKSEAIAKALHGKISEEVPASLLRKHQDVTFILDEKAASKLKNKKT